MDGNITVVDEHGQVVGRNPTGEEALSIVENSIIPYFPDNTLKRRYLAYVSSGFTKREAMIRCKDEHGVSLIQADVDQWRNTDSDFKVLDDAGYGALRDTTANAYMEMMIRRDTVMVLELNREMITIVAEKIHNNEELTKDEKFIYDKASKIYTPESIQKMVRLVQGKTSDEDTPTGSVFDFVAIVKGQVRS